MGYECWVADSAGYHDADDMQALNDEIARLLGMGYVGHCDSNQIKIGHGTAVEMVGKIRELRQAIEGLASEVSGHDY